MQEELDTDGPCRERLSELYRLALQLSQYCRRGPGVRAWLKSKRSPNIALADGCAPPVPPWPEVGGQGSELDWKLNHLCCKGHMAPRVPRLAPQSAACGGFAMPQQLSLVPAMQSRARRNEAWPGMLQAATQGTDRCQQQARPSGTGCSTTQLATAPSASHEAVAKVHGHRAGAVPTQCRQRCPGLLWWRPLLPAQALKAQLHPAQGLALPLSCWVSQRSGEHSHTHR